jgi:hypothetical protein
MSLGVTYLQANAYFRHPILHYDPIKHGWEGVIFGLDTGFLPDLKAVSDFILTHSNNPGKANQNKNYYSPRIKKDNDQGRITQ